MAALTILDAGPLVAVLDRREEHHAWCCDVLKRVRAPLVTREAVLTEALFLAAGPIPRKTIGAWLRAGYLMCEAANSDRLALAFELMDQYASVPMSFADAYLVSLAQAQGGTQIFTLDRDFEVYRDARGLPLTLIAPFAS